MTGKPSSFGPGKRSTALVWALTLVLFLGLGPQASAVSPASPEPKTIIAEAVNEVSAILNDPKLALPANKERRNDMLMATVDRFFDFREISMRTLGPRWREISEQERNRFVELFRRFLKTNYIAWVDKYDGEQVLIGAQEIREDSRGNRFALVNTSFITKARTAQVNYRLLQRRDGAWLIFDVDVEGVSLVRNFRSQFQPHSFAELIKRMEESIAAGKEAGQPR